MSLAVAAPTRVERRIAGRYELLACLGRGSVAEVFSAWDRLLDRPVTLKLFDVSIAADPELRDRFTRQVAKAASVVHPHLATLLDAGFDYEPVERVDQPFVVTEPFGSTDLHALLRQQGQLAPRRAVRLARQLADALAYLHSQGLVHADVKPENILVEEHQGRDVVKLVDLSLSFVSAATGTMTAATIARRAAYLAPEQVRGGPVTPAADVYGLGAVLYEAVAGRPPFVAPTPRATAERRVRETPQLASNFDPTLPPALDAVISRALAKSPQRRWATMQQLSDALGALTPAQLVRTAAPVLPAPPAADAVQAEREPVWSGRLAHAMQAVRLLGVLIVLALGIHVLRPLVSAALPAASGSAAASGATAAATVTVPSVVGLDVASATALAQQAGLPLQEGVEQQVTDHLPSGRIAAQSPAAGAQVTPSETLTVTVSEGVSVPDVRGQVLPEAAQTLKSLGWQVTSVTQQASQTGTAPNTVLDQQPEPGGIVPNPSNIQLTVTD